MTILKIELYQCEHMLYGANAMASCPYLLTGTEPCETGCWEEPRCITDEPARGWAEQAQYDADAAAHWARNIACDARGQHGLVKAARDLMRHAERMALR